MLHHTKKILRKHYQLLRANLPVSQQKKASALIVEYLHYLPVYQKAQHLAFYHAVKGEVALNELVKAAQLAGKHCYFPKIVDNGLIFLPDSEEMQVNSYGIPESKAALAHAIPPTKLDLIVVPMVAFDTKGHRIGSGKGYYDRLLDAIPNERIIGVAYACQESTAWDVDAWDVRMPCIVTEEGVCYTSE